jgi:hypothetical protein
MTAIIASLAKPRAIIKMAKHFTLDVRDGHFSFARNEAAIAAEAQLDGFYVVRTSVPTSEIGAEATVAAYTVRACRLSSARSAP